MSSITKHISIPAHGSAVVTCLLLAGERVISASDDHSIHVYSASSGEHLQSLDGHQGGVWCLGIYKDTLVSGSTDRTIRVWDLAAGGRCTHIFRGHTSTVRALAVVEPMVDELDARGDGPIVEEKLPTRPLIVSASRDHTLGVWNLPLPGEVEYHPPEESDDSNNMEENIHRLRFLEGHDHMVRALAAHGRTVVSGSYDCTVRVWDTISGECRWVLLGHTGKVYSVILDSKRNQAVSGSMDHTVRIWNLQSGECRHVLEGHTSLVGLIALSPSYLVSAAADSTICIWNPDTGELRQRLEGHTGAITCFQHDEYKVVSGSDGHLKVWDIRDGTLTRHLLSGITGVWQVAFADNLCVAASNRRDATVLDLWAFGEEDRSVWPRD